MAQSTRWWCKPSTVVSIGLGIMGWGMTPVWANEPSPGFQNYLVFPASPRDQFDAKRSVYLNPIVVGHPLSSPRLQSSFGSLTQLAPSEFPTPTAISVDSALYQPTTPSIDRPLEIPVELPQSQPEQPTIPEIQTVQTLQPSPSQPRRAVAPPQVDQPVEEPVATLSANSFPTPNALNATTLAAQPQQQIPLLDTPVPPPPSIQRGASPTVSMAPPTALPRPAIVPRVLPTVASTVTPVRPSVVSSSPRISSVPRIPSPPLSPPSVLPIPVSQIPPRSSQPAPIVATIPPPLQPQARPTPAPIRSSNLLPVPNSPIPIGRTNDASPPVLVSPSVPANIVALVPPSSLAPIAPVRYRVVVEVSSDQEQGQLLAVAPDAFQITTNGQSRMQAGAFTDQQRANELMDTLTSYGLKAMIESVN